MTDDDPQRPLMILTIFLGGCDGWITLQKVDLRFDSQSPKFCCIRNSIGATLDAIVVVIILVNMQGKQWTTDSVVTLLANAGGIANALFFAMKN